MGRIWNLYRKDEIMYLIRDRDQQLKTIRIEASQESRSLAWPLDSDDLSIGRGVNFGWVRLISNQKYLVQDQSEQERTQDNYLSNSLVEM